jgi:hypothetical protein
VKMKQCIQPPLVTRKQNSHANMDLNETKRMTAHNEFLQIGTSIRIDAKTVVIHLLHRENKLSQSDAKFDRISHKL